MLKILTVPEATEVLRTKSRTIEKIDSELLAFLKQLGKTLKSQKDPAGVGLSAIQVGRPVRAFAMFLPPEEPINRPDTGPKGPTPPRRGRTLSKKPILTFYVNPEITGHAAEMTLGQELTENRNFPHPASGVRRPFLEGCLSIPRIYGAVLRWPWVKAKATILSEKDFLNPSSLPRRQAGFFLLPSAFTLDALVSRVFQHEMDHLNGILFTDHVLAQGNQLFRESGRELVEMAM
jgi:peptide deformylase